MNTDAKSLRERGDALFSAKQPWDTRNQDIADNFYPERADFTVVRDIGDDFADHLVTSYPALVRRDLSNSIGSMLRPRGQAWFHLRTNRESDEDYDAKAWLEEMEGRQRRAMYDPMAMFQRATKEGDNDFATFGGAAISTEVNRRDQALLYRCWHLRDMAWAEDAYGQLGEYYRNWNPTITELCNWPGLNVHPKIRERKEREPKAKVKVRHTVIRTDEYDATKRFRHPWVSLYIDCENEHVMEERGSWTPIYTIPRWATISGSQYPYSPAALIALPDARLIQAMTLTLLDAGERASNPPLIGVAEAIRGDVNVFPGGFTAVDEDYDERLGEVLRPMSIDKSGLPYGFEMADRMNETLREAFYLNTLSMPPTDGPEMTAFEVGQRVQEYIRNALPLFEPMEATYNGALCDITFETLFHEGAFGSEEEIPESIREQGEVQFVFESPLADMVERQKGQKLKETLAIIAETASLHPSAPNIMNFRETLRDVLGGIGTPTKWLHSPAEVEAKEAADEAKQEAATLLAGMEQGANVAESLGKASQSFGEVV